jgi:hypothetical protein
VTWLASDERADRDQHRRKVAVHDSTSFMDPER